MGFSADHPHEHDSVGEHINSACDIHIKDAFEKYSSYLDKLRCICRSAIEQGAIPAEACCASNGTRAPSKMKRRRTKHKHRDVDNGIRLDTKTSQSGAKESIDLEKSATIEIVDFLVSGMDCTSCVDKLARALGVMPGVFHPHVNFVMGRGSFKIDTSQTTAGEVIRYATMASGFTLRQAIGGQYSLDILVTKAERKLVQADPPPGAGDVQVVDKKTLRISYDPTVMGARELFTALKDRCRGLAPPCADPQLQNSRRRLWDQLSKTCLAAALTIPVAVVSWGEGLVDEKTRAILSLILGTLVQAIAVPEFYRPAVSALWYTRTVEMDMLVVVSITAAYLYSVVAFGFEMAGKPLDETYFFETSTMLITLILVGRLVAAFARVRAIAAVSLRSKQNGTALLVTSHGDEDIDARLLQYGDKFRVLPHCRVPTDGIVVSGRSEVDESMLTGESLPVLKIKGSDLIAGTVNGDGSVVALLTRLPGKNTVTDIAQMVEDAANSSPKIQDLANKVAGWFVPLMIAVDIIVLVVWLVVGIKGRGHSAGMAIGNAITYAVATLAVACPCALGLAVPMVLVVAGGVAAKRGVIIKSAETTERARKITDIVFDKTGTITEDTLAVVEQISLQGDDGDNLDLAKALVTGGKHPVSAAVDKHLDKHGPRSVLEVSNIQVVPGAGIEGTCQGLTVRAGNARWTNSEDFAEVLRFQHAGLSTLVVTRGSTPVLVFGLRVNTRPEAKHVLTDLQGRGIAVHLVSGDNVLAVQTVAATLAIPPENVAAERTPPEKRDYVAKLMQNNNKYVMFCGDGTNDAVAVAQANVGAHMGGGVSSSDVTQGAADVVLLNGLEGIPLLLNVSRASFNRMAFNFVWSAIYNVLAVTMASGAWIRFRIPPAYAGLGEMVSVVPVIVAALSLLLVNFRG